MSLTSSIKTCKFGSYLCLTFPTKRGNNDVFLKCSGFCIKVIRIRSRSEFVILFIVLFLHSHNLAVALTTARYYSNFDSISRSSLHDSRATSLNSRRTNGKPDHMNLHQGHVSVLFLHQLRDNGHS